MTVPGGSLRHFWQLWLSHCAQTSSCSFGSPAATPLDPPELFFLLPLAISRAQGGLLLTVVKV